MVGQRELVTTSIPGSQEKLVSRSFYHACPDCGDATERDFTVCSRCNGNPVANIPGSSPSVGSNREVPVQRMVYTSEYITTRLQSSDRWVNRATLALYQAQEPAEQITGTTCYLNGHGYNRTDARIMSSFAAQILRGRALSPRQLEIARSLLPKYALQLSRLANG